MPVNYVALGKRIGYFRMQCVLISQEALASKINRSREFLAKGEKAQNPSVALWSVYDALCISVDDLLIDSLHCSFQLPTPECIVCYWTATKLSREIIIRTAEG